MLQEFYIRVIHIPGRTNVVADALSRLHKLDVVVSAVEPAAILDAPVVGGDVAAPLHKQEFDMVHGGVHGHFGVSKTVKMLRSLGYHWREMKKDVHKLITECIVCQKTRPMRLPDVPLRDTSTSVLFRVVALDTTGPFPESLKGFKYILVIECCFMRWVELIALRTLEAEECAESIMTAIFLRHGLPLYLRSDNGSQFVNSVIQQLLVQMGVKHHRVLPYTPQSNGHVERINKEVIPFDMSHG